MSDIKQFENKVIQGDCIEVMKTMPDNSVDTIITDPPYGLEFMGKEWDRLGNVGEGRSKKPKPAISGQEFKDRIGRVSYNATQNVRCSKCGHWKFSGTPCKCEKPDFPNIRAIQAKEMEKWHYNWATECLRVAKPGATLMAFGGTRTYHRLACAIEDAGWILKDCIMWLYGSGFPKAHDIGKSVEKIKVGGIKNLKKIGTKKGIKVETGTQGYSYNKEYVAGKCMGGKQISGDIPVYEITNDWNGWKSHGLKPAYEPIIVAMKPNEGTYANNALKHGVSGLNIDGGRIGYQNDKDKEGARWGKGEDGHFAMGTSGFKRLPDNTLANSQGRFPSNIILDEKAAELLNEQSGESKSGKYKGQGSKSGGIWQKSTGLPAGEEYGDSGGASRFFYVAKASKSERNMGCEEFYWLNGKFTIKKIWEELNKENEANKENKNFKRHNIARGCIHPTVKSLKLMEYLCLLTKTPTGGIVLDPFAGSGTTGMACKKTERKFILIEKEPEYVKIAEARIKAVVVPNQLPL